MSTQSDNALIREQAAAWLAELHDGLPDEKTVAAFDAWMDESDAHAEVYFELSESYYALDAIDLAGLNTETRSEAAPAQESNVISIDAKKAANTSKLDEQIEITETSKTPRFFKSLAAAASVAALFVMGQSILVAKADIHTSVGEIAIHELPDSSSAHLNGDTQINLAYSKTERTLDLRNGEAYFTVAKDPERPFVVRTHGANVKALGTEFTVSNRGSGLIQVAVYESSVEVTHPKYLDQPVVLSAGERIAFGPEHINANLEAFNIADAAAWRDGRLILKETPLREVIEILQAHHEGKIFVSDELLELPISGVFNRIEPTRIIHDIAETQDLETISVANRYLYVYK